MPHCRRPKIPKRQHRVDFYRYQEMNLYSLPETLQSELMLSTLADLIRQTGLNSTLSKPGPFTVFAPTNVAWSNLSPALQSALQDRNNLKNILLYHIVPGGYNLAALQQSPSLTTSNGAPIAVATYNGQIVLNNSSQIAGNAIPATNGVVYMIDRVLLPPGLTTTNVYQQLPFQAPIVNQGPGGQTISFAPIQQPNPPSTLVPQIPPAGPSLFPPFQPPSQPIFQPPSQPIFQPPSQPPFQLPSQPPFQPPTQPIVRPPVQPPTQPIVQPPIQLPAPPSYPNPPPHPPTQPPTQPPHPPTQPPHPPTQPPTTQSSPPPSGQPLPILGGTGNTTAFGWFIATLIVILVILFFLKYAGIII